MNAYNFFAHVAFALDARSHASPQATANLIIEVDDKALNAKSRQKHLKKAALHDPLKAQLAGEIGWPPPSTI